MIPAFDENGFLPPGVRPAKLNEIELRFGVQSEIRRVQMEYVRWMVDLAEHAGASRIILNGSFATDIIEPNDVDCVLLFESRPRKDTKAFGELRHGLPFIGVSIVNQREFDKMVNKVFASDRFGNPKGMIEVLQ